MHTRALGLWAELGGIFNCKYRFVSKGETTADGEIQEHFSKADEYDGSKEGRMKCVVSCIRISVVNTCVCVCVCECVCDYVRLSLSLSLSLSLRERLCGLMFTCVYACMA